MDLVNLRVLGERRAPACPLAEQLGALADLRDEGKLDLHRRQQRRRSRALERALELVEVARSRTPTASSTARTTLARLSAASARSPSSRSSRSARRSWAARRARRGPGDRRRRRAHGATPSQVALAWLLARDERILLIPGTTSVAHLEENLAAGDLELDAEDLEPLAAVEEVGHAAR